MWARNASRNSEWWGIWGSEEESAGRAVGAKAVKQRGTVLDAGVFKEQEEASQAS
jgi:hypothetical protein